MSSSGAGTNRDEQIAAWRTEQGFYLGDAVETPDGRRGCLDEIVVPLVHYSDEHGTWTASVVRLDDEFWLDGSLTRVG